VAVGGWEEENGGGQRQLSYEDLKNRLSLPGWVDHTQLEVYTHPLSLLAIDSSPLAPLRPQVYLSDEDFARLFGMSRLQFSQLKPWRKQQCKKAAGLF
jgi:hypothetical protein